MDVRHQIVTDLGKTWGVGSRKSSITIHETANLSRGADAQAHANLQSRGNVRQASWHWQVDDKRAIQSFPHGVRCWHAGSAGADSIAIEICVNSDSDYGKALQNAAELVRLIRSQEGDLPIYDHHHWTGKNCPTRLRAGTYGLTWSGFNELAEDDVALTDSDIDKIVEKVWKARLFTLNGNEAKAVASASEGDTRSAGALLQRTLVLAYMARIRDIDVEVDAKAIADLIPDSIARDVADVLAERLKG